MLLSYIPGDVVTYIDERGRPHAALVTCWWGAHEQAACNLVYIDETVPGDSFGAQRVAVASVSRGPTGAPGRYWQPSHEPVTLVADDFAAPAEATAPAPA